MKQIMNKIKLAFVMSALLVGNIALADLNTGLVAYYPFEGTAQDLSNNQNHGIENGGLVYTDGVTGQAVKLDGIDDWIQVNNSTSFPKTEISISYWLKQNSLPSYLSNNISKEFSFQSYLLGSGLFESGVWKGSAGQWSGYHSGNYKYKVNSWVLYTWTFSNTTKKSKTFINGKLVSEVTENDTNAYLRTSSEPMYIGRNGSQDVYHVNGSIDELRIYDRVLSNTEVTSLYNAGLALSGTVKSLSTHTVVCKNETTGQILNITSSKATAYDCEAKGLKVNAGETASIFIKGVVQ
jgi:hypothetical protein